MVDDLSLPDVLLNKKNLLKMVTILFPCTVKKVVPSEYKNERIFLVKAFGENSAKIRQKFFSEPLVKYLWINHFMKESPGTVLSYLRSMRSKEHGEHKLKKFLQNLEWMETACNYKIFPESFTSEDSIMRFSQEEKEEYLIKNNAEANTKSDEIR